MTNLYIQNATKELNFIYYCELTQYQNNSQVNKLIKHIG